MLWIWSTCTMSISLMIMISYHFLFFYLTFKSGFSLLNYFFNYRGINCKILFLFRFISICSFWTSYLFNFIWIFYVFIWIRIIIEILRILKVLRFSILMIYFPLNFPRSVWFLHIYFFCNFNSFKSSVKTSI